MKNKTLLIGLVIFQTAQLSAIDKLSIYDPLGALSSEERSRIEAEGRTIITNRKVNGQDLLIQIDFLSEDEFDEGGVTGRDESGRTLFSLGTYSNWSMEYFSQPAVLMLFLDEGSGNYVLDALNFSDMLMDEGIPDLVRRYIRDEIMKKETSYVETISSGLYAIGEALNPVYKERLINEHVSLFNNNQFKRRHAYYVPFEYWSFNPYHANIERNVMGPFPESQIVNNEEYFDWSSISVEGTETINASSYGAYTVPDLRAIIDNPRTAEDNEQLLEDRFRLELEEIASERSHYLNTDQSAHNSDLIVGSQVTLEDRVDVFGCRIVVEEDILDTQWDYIPDPVNEAIYSGWGPKGPTWCNQYGRELGCRVFGKCLFDDGKTANDIHDYMMSNSGDYVELIDGVDEPSLYINKGYMVYFVFKNNGGIGHFETGIPSQPSGITSINELYQIFTLNPNEQYTVGAGATVGAKTLYTDDSRFTHFLYLGYLKKL